jgi:hypothetical protein
MPRHTLKEIIMAVPLSRSNPFQVPMSARLVSGCLGVAVVLASSTAIAEFGGHVGATVTEPRQGDTAFELELGFSYTAPVGIYGEVLFSSHDFADSDQSLSNDGSVEASIGYSTDITDGFGIDLGLTFYDSPDLGTDAYLGLNFALVEGLDLSLYGYTNVKSEIKESSLELEAVYDVGMFDIFGLYTRGFQDNEDNLLEIGVGKSLFSSHYVSLSYEFDMDDSKGSSLILYYEISF